MEGKMEGKTRKVKRLAFFTAAFMAALFLFAGQPHKVFAGPLDPQVSPNGVGDLLVFSYWTTQDRETFITIVNAFGPNDPALSAALGLPVSRFVHIRFHEGVASREMIDFTICLSRGDVWTASLTSAGDDTSSNLTVGNPGSCDAAVPLLGLVAPPPPAFPLRISTELGYIEAYTFESPTTGTGTDFGGDDTIWGVATVVNTSDGFSSSYNATAFVNTNAPTEGPSVVGAGTLTTPRSAISQALAREGGVDKEILFARYVAGDIFAAETQIVLTFPTGFQPGVADPVSLYFFDEEENPNLFSHELLLPWEVNVCKITYVSGAPTTGDLIQNVSCPGTGNDFDILGLQTYGGWVRIINNNIGTEFPEINRPPATRFPVIGTVFSSFFGGGFTINYDQSFPIQWAAIGGAGGVGGIGCRPVGGVIAPTCNSFDIASTFAPWYIPDTITLAGLITPGDGSTGALIRTGTTGP